MNIWRWVIVPLLIGLVEGSIVGLVVSGVTGVTPAHALLLGGIVAVLDFVGTGLFLFVHDNWDDTRDRI